MSLRLLCLQIALVFFGVVIAISEQSLVAALLLYLLCHTDGKCQVWVFFCSGLGGYQDCQVHCEKKLKKINPDFRQG